MQYVPNITLESFFSVSVLNASSVVNESGWMVCIYASPVASAAIRSKTQALRCLLLLQLFVRFVFGTGFVLQY